MECLVHSAHSKKVHYVQVLERLKCDQHVPVSMRDIQDEEVVKVTLEIKVAGSIAMMGGSG
jgi:hypothetical protein